MTKALSAQDVARTIGERFPDAVVEGDEAAVFVDGGRLLDVARFLKDSPDLRMDYLSNLTAVDYKDHFEVVYSVNSIEHNHGIVVKVRCHDREAPSVPSVVSVWQGADFQEREVYDLMGISFAGHPNPRRIMLWPGFDGHPLRKDWGQAQAAPAEGGAEKDAPECQ
ncbi:MAG: NADH-quinone oxidoreductase subunit C [Chloroflexota bacterium]|nr:NADH-quinone oxidoreductase subunit C [Chloroflexota bacterium]